MFPIDAIKQATMFALLADDYFAHLDILLDETPYVHLANRITTELVYYQLYRDSLVPELHVEYTELCSRLIQLINAEADILLFESEDELHQLIGPLRHELEVLFKGVRVNNWGMYLVQINYDYLEISYVGDYRIIEWSKSDVAENLKQSLKPEQIFGEVSHSFKQTKKH